MDHPVSITASYAFTSLKKEALADLRQELLAFGRPRGMRGLALIAPEGINSTVSGSAEVIQEWKALLESKFGKMIFKDSGADKEVFRRFSVKIKEEIVTIKDPTLHPQGKNGHLSPEEWQEMLQKEDVILIDARNSYEYAIGKFKNAIDCGTRVFHEFPEFIRKAEIPKDKKVMMYCTGGIRCDKALLAMKAEGYDHVYQLEGGILAYLEKFPNANFEGECFVFDHRVAVDQKLRPSQTYDLCPHCGDPGDLMIVCRCNKQKRVCKSCAQDASKQTCSKRCRNELLRDAQRSKTTA